VNGSLFLRNRQRTRNVDSAYLKKIILSLIERTLGRKDYELGVHLVARPQITEINETYLRHKGPTDVITFDYGDPSRVGWLAGDIFVCVPEAVDQARLFESTWQNELVRYIVHGALHLCGYDDRGANQRARMKREEDRLVAELSGQFAFSTIGGPAKKPVRRKL
jgi:probable rRNA maturation factor